MCGISGFNWGDKELGTKMNTCLEHRGPDSAGLFCDEGITLAHRRLAVIDLSVAANQPMEDEQSVVIFNGEIYNYKELKEELKSEYLFKTQSDTEVILAGYQKWGKNVVLHLEGIFSFAVWDKVGKDLFVARDHLGVKPFYYFWDGKKFIFSSEIKSILTHDVPRILDKDSFNQYMRVLYVPSPKTMLKNIFKLPPGCSATLIQHNLIVEEYYRPSNKFNNLSYRDTVKEVKKRVEKAVERQLVADVPVGIYLSGGIDSSIVLAAASKTHKNIKTFSVGFDLDDDEEKEKFNRDSDIAKQTAEYFNADHHELRISTQDVVKSLVEVIGSIDDPISNPTSIPMAYLSKFAKREVTVVLSGNGGDELFGGYERYRMSSRVDFLKKIPGIKYFLPKKIRGAMEMTALDRLVQFEFEKDKRLERVLDQGFFKRVGIVKEDFKKYTENSNSKTEALMLADLTLWLPDQALSLGDKMSMRGSLEERVPLLDQSVVDFAMGIPVSFKVDPFRTKKILKDAFKKDLPPYLFKEPKRGWFSPGAKWIRQPGVLSIFKEILKPGYYPTTSSIFNWTEIEEMLDAHVDKSDYNLTILWAIFTFQVWAKKYGIYLP